MKHSYVEEWLVTTSEWVIKVGFSEEVIFKVEVLMTKRNLSSKNKGMIRIIPF